MNKYKQGTNNTTTSTSSSTPSPSPSSMPNMKSSDTMYTYPGNLFSVMYPKTWKQSIENNPSGETGPDNMQKDVVLLAQPNAPTTLGDEKLGVIMTFFKSSDTATS